MNHDFTHHRQYLQGGRRYVAGLSSLLVVIVLAITGFLNIGSFQKSYIDSLVSSYAIQGSEARRTIEYSVKHHKPLDNFVGMGEILTGVKRTSPSVENVYVLSPLGETLYDATGPDKTTVLSRKQAEKINFSKGWRKKTPEWLLFNHQYHSLIPLRDADGEWIGTLDIVFDEQSVSKELSSYMWQTLEVMGAISLLTILLLVVTVYRMRLFDSGHQLNRKGLTIVIALILGAAQASFGVINVLTFRAAYLKVVNHDLNIAADLIGKEINHVIGFGFSCRELDGVDEWLQALVKPVKDIDRVVISDPLGRLLYSSSVIASQSLKRSPGLAASQSSNQGNPFSFLLDARLPVISRTLAPDIGGESATFSITVSAPYVRQKLWDLALDAVTMFLTSIFFLVETLVFIIILLTNYTEKLSHNLRLQTSEKEKKFIRSQNENCVRVLGFLLLLCSYMSISFIPLLMKEIYHPLLGLSPDVVIALPIASEMFGAFLSSLLVGHLIDRHGWRPVFVYGFIILAAATLISAFAIEPVSFILIRCIVGVGYGAAWMGLRGLVAAATTPHQRSHGFSILNAGIFAGQNCAAVLGALLAERLGFSMVLILASLMILIALPFTSLLTLNSKPAVAGEDHPGNDAVWRFFADKQTFLFFLLITIPSAITSSFLNYFFPLFANSLHVSQGNIGRGFLLYGICIVFIGPLLDKRLKALVQENLIIIGSCLFGVLALVLFCSMPTFLGALGSILILGISDSLGLVSQNNYFINLPSCRRLGHGKALSFYSAVKKIGQLAGPAVFGALISMGMVAGVGFVAGGYLMTTGWFGFLKRKATSQN
jgi:predicted MFS family arabinose efflux permease